MIVYGPVPSRRLGQSIGINNIPPKACSYSCAYCQIGRTNPMQITRSAFYQPEEICIEAETKLRQLETEHKKADYFSFVPDGEPTLDVNLGRTIGFLKPYQLRIAVITNGSLLWLDSVKQDLMDADWVSVSMDAASETVWRKIDRPHGKLNHQVILDGIQDFSQAFRGTFVTETMLVDGFNDDEKSVIQIAEQLAVIQPSTAYLLVPTRPPAESGIRRASHESLKRAAAIIRGITGIDVVCITGDEKEEGFFFTEDVAADLLSIASVHPVREDIIENLLNKRNADKEVVSKLVDDGELIVYAYEGKRFYKRKLCKDPRFGTQGLEKKPASY